jgi:hypothetical protein
MAGQSLSQRVLEGVQTGLETTKVGANAIFTILPSQFPELSVSNPMDMLARMTGAALEGEGRNPHEAQIAVSHRPLDGEYRVRFVVTHRRTVKLDMPATSWKDRVQVERDELSARMQKLQEFLFRNAAFHKLPETQKALMHEQYLTMERYRTLLDMRLCLPDEGEKG